MANILGCVIFRSPAVHFGDATIVLMSCCVLRLTARVGG